MVGRYVEIPYKDKIVKTVTMFVDKTVRLGFDEGYMSNSETISFFLN